MTRLLVRRGRHAGESLAADQDVFSRHRGRHCRHGSLTGWAALAQFQPAAADFSRIRRTPLAVVQMAAPYDPSKGSAA